MDDYNSNLFPEELAQLLNTLPASVRANVAVSDVVVEPGWENIKPKVVDIASAESDVGSVDDDDEDYDRVSSSNRRASDGD